MRFLIDCQLPPDFAARLRAIGFAADHASEIDLAGRSDLDIWRYAEREACCIVTKDQDFAYLVKTRAAGPAVLWIRSGNTRNEALWARLGPRMPQVAAMIEAGERLIEVR